MNDESELRRMARQAVQEGKMPGRKPDRMWGGPANGGSCSICGVGMPRGEIGLEVEFRAREAGNLPFTHQLHARCLAAWEDELLANPAAADRIRSNQSSATKVDSSGSAGNGAALIGLHAHGGDGTIADRERDLTQPRGAG